jgi:hypothetical protein
MKIKYDGKSRTEVSFKDLFYIGKYKWDEADYGFSIILFGYEWNWLVYKNQESLFEHQQEIYDYQARYMKWQNENRIERKEAI